MMRAILAVLMLFVFVSGVSAHPRHHWHHHWQHRPHVAYRHHGRHYLTQGRLRRAQNFRPWAWNAPVAESGRPRDCYGIPWCGCFMRHLFGIADTSLNLAANWAHWGSPSRPGEGVVVVWRHHVGIIRGGPDEHGRWLVQSGNDGHAVRTRYRSLAGAIAFRQG